MRLAQAGKCQRLRENNNINIKLGMYELERVAGQNIAGWHMTTGLNRTIEVVPASRQNLRWNEYSTIAYYKKKTKYSTTIRCGPTRLWLD